MSPEQTTTAAIGLVVVVVLEKVYSIFMAGQKLDDRIQKKINDAAAKDQEADDLRKELAQREFDHMATDIKRICESIAEIMRMLRESVATKQDILQLDARVDALEESNRAHYDSFRRLDRELSQVRERCGSHHRKAGESSAFPLERSR